MSTIFSTLYDLFQGTKDHRHTSRCEGRGGSVSRVLCDVLAVPKLIDLHTTAVAMDEIAMANNEETRHAMTMVLAQQEILNVVGSLLL